ncbi:hypothetical protein ATANTOWER_004749 [Ataeniobius toweri]|uniref:Uncharacterized protein n=1 Tax=Ataeniobius toweri TaxID=208326 RepID=A0ABU7AWT7_9TELE|nr:hypothetical protein [Ataeniobius toweri]
MLEMLGIDPRTSYMQSMRSTTELHPLCLTHAIYANRRRAQRPGCGSNLNDRVDGVAHRTLNGPISLQTDKA